MNGPQDLGGRHGFGPINAEAEADEPVFHAEWEKHVLGATLLTAALGQWSLDSSRHARERIPPARYLGESYYEIWMDGLETLLLEAGIVTEEELRTGKAVGPAPDSLQARKLPAEKVRAVLASGGPVDMPPEDAPRFKVGDKVRARNRHPKGHTREPGYVRGHMGTVHEHYGAHVFPDMNARGERVGRHLYSVRFEAEELWGDDTEGRGAVYVDLWQDYLEPVEA